MRRSAKVKVQFESSSRLGLLTSRQRDLADDQPSVRLAQKRKKNAKILGTEVL